MSARFVVMRGTRGRTHRAFFSFFSSISVLCVGIVVCRFPLFASCIEAGKRVTVVLYGSWPSPSNRRLSLAAIKTWLYGPRSVIQRQGIVHKHSLSLSHDSTTGWSCIFVSCGSCLERQRERTTHRNTSRSVVWCTGRGAVGMVERRY